MSEVLYLIHLIIVGFGWIVLLMLFLIASVPYSYEEQLLYIKSALICTAVYIGLVIFFITGEIKLDKQPWNYSKPYATEKIVSLSDSNQINGHFHVRRGYIGEKLYYQYMVDLKSGGYKANKVGADNTTLFYDNKNCRVEWYEKERHWLYFSETEKYQKIYIPEGSITDDYMIDLQ